MLMKIAKILFSIPVILLLLFFLPPLGIIVLLARYVVFGNLHFYRAPFVIIATSAIIALPFGLDWLLKVLHAGITIPYLSNILDWEYYPKLLDFAKFSFIVAIIVLIVAILLRNLINTISSKISQLIGGYYSDMQRRDEAIAKENDYKLKEKAIESKQKTPHVVKCPHCGKTNPITGTVGKCSSCRSAIEYHGKH